MTKLSDMQLVLLASAAQREDGSVLPLPDSLGDQADRIRKAVAALLKRNLIGEQEVTAAPQVWRKDGDLRIGVAITDAGRAIIATEEGEPANSASASPVTIAATDVVATAAAPRAGSKQAMVLDMLRADAGASLTELVAATGWLPHTTRAALTGLRKKGHPILTEKGETGTRYRIADAA